MTGSGGLFAWLWLKGEFFDVNWKRVRGELRCRLDAAQLIHEMRKPRNQVVTLERSEYLTEEDLNDPTIDLLPGRDWAYLKN